MALGGSPFAGIQNLIFDLGGVLYGVDYKATETALGKLQESAAEIPVFSRSTQPECFTLYETGRISKDEFRIQLRRAFNITTADDAQLDAAWCAILMNAYPGRTELLGRLHRHYRMALLSNTNEIHIDVVKEQCPELLAQFDTCFYSHELGMRKPHPEIFEHVLEAMNFRPEETLFLDDSRQHLQGAESLGIHTVWVRHPEVVEVVAELLLREKERQ